MGPTLILTVAMALPMGGHGHHKAWTAPRAVSCSCNHCDACDHGCKGPHGFWAKRGLPAPCIAPDNMMPHLPYHTEAMRYYYFRPYNHMHIPVQQAEATSVGISYSQPYSNAIFQRVYAEVEARGVPEQVPAHGGAAPLDVPPVPEPPSDSPLDSNAMLGVPLTLVP